MSNIKHTKYRDFFLGLLLDGLGMVSYLIPGIGEFSDIIWAPIAGWLMTRIYKGKVGQAAGIFAFIEELIPGLDMIPSFTIMWFYTYIFRGAKEPKVINIDPK